MSLGRTLLLKFYYFCSVLQFVGQPTKTLRTVITFFSKCYIFLTRAVLNKKKTKARKRENPSHKLNSNYKLLNCTNYKRKQYNRFLNIGSPVKFK